MKPTQMLKVFFILSKTKRTEEGEKNVCDKFESLRPFLFGKTVSSLPFPKWL